MKETLKKFFLGMREWFVDSWDEAKLFEVEERIHNLYKDLDEEPDFYERKYLHLQLEICSKEHNEILRRIQDREARQKQVVIH